MKLQTDLSYFVAKNFFGDDGFQNMFVYQPTLDTLKLKNDKGTDYVLVGSHMGYTSKLYTAFIHSIKLSGYKMVIKFDKHPLAVKQNNHATKIVNAYIFNDLDASQKIPLINFKLKNCLFGATSIVKNRSRFVEIW